MSKARHGNKEPKKPKRAQPPAPAAPKAGPVERGPAAIDPAGRKR